MSTSQTPSSSTGAGERRNKFRPIPPDYNAWQHMTRTIEHYERLDQVGEGTYGQVYRARCRDSGRIVALKKMRIQHGGYWGMPLQFIREIKILKRLQHPNLLQMIEVVTSKGVEHLDNDDPRGKNFQVKDKAADVRESYKGNLFLVLEYVDHDLAGLLDVAYQFTPVQIKCIFKQLLEALAFMHQHKYVHRDIKSSNLLLDSNFHLKLADFGLARSIEKPLLDQVQDRKASLASGPEWTNKVITLWYRPPEILLGAVQYGAAVDVWSAGCILAELILGKPLFVAKTDLDMLNIILEILGPPLSAETYDFFESGMKKDTSKVPLSLSRTQRPPARLREKYGEKIPPAALSLLEKMLAWDPRQRVTAENALGHRYFWTEPVAPDDPAELDEKLKLGPNGHFHEFQTKKKRKEAKAKADEAKEKAKVKGKSEAEAEAVHKKVYQKLMKKVWEEGVGVSERSENASSKPDDLDGSQRSGKEARRYGAGDSTEQARTGESRASHGDDPQRQRSHESHARYDSETGKKRRREDREDRHHRRTNQMFAGGGEQPYAHNNVRDFHQEPDPRSQESSDAPLGEPQPRPHENPPVAQRNDNYMSSYERYYGQDDTGYSGGRGKGRSRHNEKFQRGDRGPYEDRGRPVDQPSLHNRGMQRDAPPYEERRFGGNPFPRGGRGARGGRRGRGGRGGWARPLDSWGPVEGRGRGKHFREGPFGTGSTRERPSIGSDHANRNRGTEKAPETSGPPDEQRRAFHYRSRETGHEGEGSRYRRDMGTGTEQEYGSSRRDIPAEDRNTFGPTSTEGSRNSRPDEYMVPDDAHGSDRRHKSYEKHRQKSKHHHRERSQGRDRDPDRDDIGRGDSGSGRGSRDRGSPGSKDRGHHRDDRRDGRGHYQERPHHHRHR